MVEANPYKENRVYMFMDSGHTIRAKSMNNRVFYGMDGSMYPINRVKRIFVTKKPVDVLG